MDALAREYRDTHDPEIPEEIFELARRLRRWTIEGGRDSVWPLFSCAEITGGDISISPKRWLIDVLIFHCSNCNETINSADDESTDQIFARLEEHVTKCLLATFTFDGTTDIARQRVGAWRAVIERERLVGRLRLH
jgi:hypothetical protein